MTPMDGSHERQGVLPELAARPLVELQEMLARQERLQASGLLARTADGGERVRTTISRLRLLIARREAGGDTVRRAQGGDDDEEEEEEDVTVPPPRTARPDKFVPNRARQPPILEAPEEQPSVAAVADALARVSLAADGLEDLRVPDLSDREWQDRASLQPRAQHRECPKVPRATPAEVPDLSLVVIDCLPDPSRPEAFLQLSARKLPNSDATVDSLRVECAENLYCLPGYIGDAFSRRCGLRIHVTTSQEKTETADAVAEPTLRSWDVRPTEDLPTRPADEALRLWWRFVAADAGEGPVLLLLLPPPRGSAGQRQRLLRIVERAVGKSRSAFYLCDLTRCEWSAELLARLQDLRRDLDPQLRCLAAADFLKCKWSGVQSLLAAAPAVRLADSLARLEWGRMRAENLATLRYRLFDVGPSPVISAQQASDLAARGWNYAGLDRAYTGGWTGFLTALVSREEAKEEEKVEMVRKLFRHFEMKFKKMELHRGELLPEHDPVTSRARMGGTHRRAIHLPLDASLDLTVQKGRLLEERMVTFAAEQLRRRAAPTARAAPGAHGFLHGEYRDRAPEEEEEDEEEEEEDENAGYHCRGEDSDGEEGERWAS